MSSRLTYLLGSHHAEWSYDDEYLSFVTPELISTSIVSLAQEHFAGLIDKVIWDMFAGIGTDSIRLSQVSGRVICTELNKGTFKHLKSNIQAMGATNIQATRIDCCDYAERVNCNIIYFDPPWGDSFQSGTKFDFVNVILSNGKNVLDIVQEMHKKADLIIKSPFTCQSFDTLFDEKYIIGIFAFRQQKLKFLFIKKMNSI